MKAQFIKINETPWVYFGNEKAPVDLLSMEHLIYVILKESDVHSNLACIGKTLTKIKDGDVVTDLAADGETSPFILPQADFYVKLLSRPLDPLTPYVQYEEYAQYGEIKVLPSSRINYLSSSDDFGTGLIFQLKDAELNVSVDVPDMPKEVGIEWYSQSKDRLVFRIEAGTTVEVFIQDNQILSRPYKEPLPVEEVFNRKGTDEMLLVGEATISTRKGYVVMKENGEIKTKLTGNKKLKELDLETLFKAQEILKEVRDKR